MPKSAWPKIANNLDKIAEMAMDGVYEKEMARFLGMSEKTWYKYKAREEEGAIMRQALHEGRKVLITDLKKALYKKAKGFEHEETKVTYEETANGSEKKKVEKHKKYYAPDVGALVFALTNLTQRDDDIFLNRQDVVKTTTHKGNINFEQIGTDELRKLLKESDGSD